MQHKVHSVNVLYYFTDLHEVAAGLFLLNTEILTFFKATGISQVAVCKHGNVTANERTENMNVNNVVFKYNRVFLEFVLGRESVEQNPQL